MENINLARAEEIMRHSHNDGTLPTAFHLSFDEFGTDDAIKFAGAALRKNHSIGFLRIDCCGKTFDADTLENLLHFVSNNPSLNFLQLINTPTDENEESNEDGDEEEARSSSPEALFLDAAAANESIHHIVFAGDPIKRSPSKKKKKKRKRLNLSLNLKALHFRGIATDLKDVWLPHHAIESLCLEKGRGQSKGEYKKKLSDLLEALEGSSSSRSIQRLHVDGWTSALPTFLISKNSCLQSLLLRNVNFSHTKGGFSAMDGLLWGLSANTASWLHLDSCAMDHLAFCKLTTSLQLGQNNIQNLGLSKVVGLEDEDLGKLVACERLQALKLDYEPLDKSGGFLLEGLQSNMRIESMRLSACFTGLYPALKSALTTASLRNLELSSLSLDSADCQSVIGLVENPNCRLKLLALDSIDYKDGSDCLFYPDLFAALEHNNQLETLRLGDIDPGRIDIISTLLGGIAKAKNLKELEILFQFSWSSVGIQHPHTTDELFTEAISKNWSLEELTLAAVLRRTLPHVKVPAAGPSLEEKIQQLCQRNIFKKRIDSSSVEMTVYEKALWVEELYTMLQLPDGLTLAFCLLQQRPGCFFREEGSPLQQWPGCFFQDEDSLAAHNPLPSNTKGNAMKPASCPSQSHTSNGAGLQAPFFDC